jgi:hypothetical protein
MSEVNHGPATPPEKPPEPRRTYFQRMRELDEDLDDALAAIRAQEAAARISAVEAAAGRCELLERHLLEVRRLSHELDPPS